MLYFKFLIRLLAALYLLAEFDSNRQKAERPASSKADCNQLNRAAAQDCPAKYSSPYYRPLQNLSHTCFNFSNKGTSRCGAVQLKPTAKICGLD